MARHLLSDLKVRNAKPKQKPYRRADGEGLFLYVAPSGVRSWQFRYRLDGKQQTLTIGKADKLPLADARTEADKARKTVAQGRHLTVAKRLARAEVAATDAQTFGAVAKLWARKRSAKARWSPKHRAQVEASIENHLSALKPLPVTEITAAVVTPTLDAVERRAPLMFEKVRARLHRILDHAVMTGALERNPLPRPEPEKQADRRHYPAVTKLPGLGEILRAARAADPCKGIQRAHALLAFTAQRVSEVVGATWDEFDLRAGTWAIPRERMKRKDEVRGPHVIPLPSGLLRALREWRDADAESSKFVCPAPRDPKAHITPEACEKFYRTALELVGKHSPHSWRSAFSTVCREAGKDGDVIEAQLDHVVGNKVAAAYDRAQRLELRRALMAWYESMLIAARDGASVVPIAKAKR
jgi:integrase